MQAGITWEAQSVRYLNGNVSQKMLGWLMAGCILNELDESQADEEEIEEARIVSMCDQSCLLLQTAPHKPTQAQKAHHKVFRCTQTQDHGHMTQPNATMLLMPSCCSCNSVSLKAIP